MDCGGVGWVVGGRSWKVVGQRPSLPSPGGSLIVVAAGRESHIGWNVGNHRVKVGEHRTQPKRQLSAARASHHSETAGGYLGTLLHPKDGLPEVFKGDFLKLLRQAGDVKVRQRQRGIAVSGEPDGVAHGSPALRASQNKHAGMRTGTAW